MPSAKLFRQARRQEGRGASRIRPPPRGGWPEPRRTAPHCPAAPRRNAGFGTRTGLAVRPDAEREAENPMTNDVEVAVIGAGQAGLAMGSSLEHRAVAS